MRGLQGCYIYDDEKILFSVRKRENLAFEGGYFQNFLIYVHLMCNILLYNTAHWFLRYVLHAVSYSYNIVSSI